MRALVADVSATCTVPLVLTRFVHVTQFTGLLDRKTMTVLFDLAVRTSRARFLRQPRDRRKSNRTSGSTPVTVPESAAHRQVYSDTSRKKPALPMGGSVTLFWPPTTVT